MSLVFLSKTPSIHTNSALSPRLIERKTQDFAIETFWVSPNSYEFEEVRFFSPEPEKKGTGLVC
jgi:hypothetical protein